MNIVSKEGFQGSFYIYLNVLKILENNYKFLTKTICEPQLGKRGLYPNISKWPDKNSWLELRALWLCMIGLLELRKLINCLSFADGRKDLIDLSDSIDVNTQELLNILEKLIEKKLILIKK